MNLTLSDDEVAVLQRLDGEWQSLGWKLGPYAVDRPYTKVNPKAPEATLRKLHKLKLIEVRTVTYNYWGTAGGAQPETFLEARLSEMWRPDDEEAG